MTKPEPLADLPSSRRATRPRFQFSLFWLMVAVTTVAIVLGFGAYLGPVFGTVWFATLYFVRCALVTLLLICAIYGRGRDRALSIGGLVPWVISIHWEMSFFVLVLTLCYSAACAFVATAAWRWVVSGKEH